MSLCQRTKNNPVLFLLCRIKSKLFFFWGLKSNSATLCFPTPGTGRAWASANLILDTSRHLSFAFPWSSITHSEFSCVCEWYVMKMSFPQELCMRSIPMFSVSCRCHFGCFMLLFRGRIIKHLFFCSSNALANYRNEEEGKVISINVNEQCVA